MCPIRSRHPLFEFSPVLENFRRALSPDPKDCPWVSEDGGKPVGYLQAWPRIRGFELETTENKSSLRDMNSGPPDFKFSALTARPRRLLILHYSVLVKKYKKTFFVLFINTSFPILHNLTQEEPIK